MHIISFTLLWKLTLLPCIIWSCPTLGAQGYEIKIDADGNPEGNYTVLAYQSIEGLNISANGVSNFTVDKVAHFLDDPHRELPVYTVVHTNIHSAELQEKQYIGPILDDRLKEKILKP